MRKKKYRYIAPRAVRSIDKNLQGAKRDLKKALSRLSKAKDDSIKGGHPKIITMEIRKRITAVKRARKVVG